MIAGGVIKMITKKLSMSKHAERATRPSLHGLLFFAYSRFAPYSQGISMHKPKDPLKKSKAARLPIRDAAMRRLLSR